MAYRSDLEAAHARSEALDRELGELRERNRELESQLNRVRSRDLASRGGHPHVRHHRLESRHPDVSTARSFDDDGREISGRIDPEGRRQALRGLAIMGGGLLISGLGMATGVGVFHLLGLGVFGLGLWYGCKT